MTDRDGWLNVDFLPEGNAGRLLGEGWSFQEAGGIWAVGQESAMSLPPAPSDGEYRLELVAWPMLMPPDVMRQRLEVVLNGRSIYSGELTGAEPALTGCVVPPGVLRTDDSNRLVLLHPDAAAPASFGPAHGDHRQLGICVLALRLEAQAEKPAPDAAARTGTLPGEPTAAAERGLVLCYWERTAYEIGCILEFFPPFEDAFELRFVPNTIAWEAFLPTLPEADRRRVVAVWEEVADPRAEPYHNPRNPLPRSIARVRFPRLTMRCLWPLQGHDPRSVPEPPFYPQGRYPYADVAALQLLGEAALPDDALYRRYLSVSGGMLRDPELELADDLARWRALDARSDIKVAEHILENFRSVAQFHAPDIPAGPLLAYVTEHLLASLLPGLAIRPSELYRQFTFYIHGYQGPFFDQAPIHPTLVEKFGLTYLDPEPRYRRGHGKRTFAQHIVDYIRWAPWFS